MIPSDERPIIEALIQNILDRGLPVTVYDEEELVLKDSSDLEEILSETAHTDLTHYSFPGGAFILIHGNGEDVISDCADTDLCDDIFNQVIS